MRRQWFCVLIFLAVFLLGCQAHLIADIQGLKLLVSDPADPLGKKFNGGQTIRLNASWEGGTVATPPFSISFYSGSTKLDTSNQSSTSKEFTVTASTLGNGLKNFKVEVIETAVQNAVMKSADSDKSVDVDLTPPTVEVILDNGTVFSPNPGFNLVKFTVKSSKNVQGSPDVTVTPTITGVTITPDGTPTEKTFKYNLQLPAGVTASDYSIKAVARDTTLPSGTENSGNGQAVFTVKSEGPLTPTINVSEPASPVLQKSFSLKGKTTAGMTKITVYEGATEIVLGTITGTDWTATVPVDKATEGEHKYTVKGLDALGNLSPASSEFTVKVDASAPDQGVLVAPTGSTSAAKIKLNGTSAIDPLKNGVNSPPVKVGLYKMGGSQIASVTATVDGAFSFNDVSLVEGENFFYVITEDSANGPPGNKSNPSTQIKVVRDNSLTPTITVSQPASPVQQKSFSLKGKITTGMTKITVYEGATEISQGTISGSDWNAFVPNVNEGEHKYIVKGIDALGNESPPSPEFIVKVDVTAPAAGVLVQPQSPTSATKINITGTSAVDNVNNGVNSPPVKVALYKMGGSEIATVAAAVDGTFSFSDVDIVDGDNFFYVVTEDSANGPPGNKSNPSAQIKVVRDTTAPSVGSVLIGSSQLATQPLPLSETNPLGTGSYGIQIDFSKDMDATVNPSVSYTPLNGTEQVSTTGTWIASKTFLASISIPSGQSATFDGIAKELKISGAKDTAGTVMSPYTLTNPFKIVTTPPVPPITPTTPIVGLKCTITEPADTVGKKYNAGVSVKLNTSWTSGGTPPFSASFFALSGAAANSLGTAISSTNSADFVTTGAKLGAGQKGFKVDVLETAIPNIPMVSATSDKNIEIDITAPVITITLDNGSTFSPSAGFNVVKFTVKSSKGVQGVPDISISPEIAGAAPAPDGTPTETNFKYTLQLPATVVAGGYTIKAVCKDTTLPLETANSGTGQIGFSVNGNGPQPTTVIISEPASPVQQKNFSLKGKISNGMTAISVFENGAKVADGVINGPDWSASLANAPEGLHRYTVRGTDALGNLSPESAEIIVKVDLTSPTRGVLVQPQSPTSSDKISITGTSALDPLNNGVNSPPVKVGLYSMSGTEMGSVTANLDGTFTFLNVNLADGDNVFYVITEDSANGPPGNRSNPSAPIKIIRDNAGSNIAAVLIGSPKLATQPLPIVGDTWLSAGSYGIQVDFSKEMDSSIKPVISYTPLNGIIQVSNNGSWVASRTFSCTITIPGGQSAAYDGMAIELKISAAKDIAGTVMAAYTVSNPFRIDTKSPVTVMDSMAPILVASGVTSVNIKGSSSDSGSGVGYVEIAWQNKAGGAISSQTVPIFNGANASWTTYWDVSALSEGYYKLWAVAADRAEPNPNKEAMYPTGFRLVAVDRDMPTVNRVSLNDILKDINDMYSGTTVPVIASSVTKLIAVFSDPSGWGIDFSRSLFTLMHEESGTNITGNYTNNGTDTMYFTFPKLTLSGTYTVSVNPMDKSGNAMPLVATRTFIIDNGGPSTVTFQPISGAYANNTNPAIALDQLWAFIDDPEADYINSTIAVAYNGMKTGAQINGASTTALIWDFTGNTATHTADQSIDGRYNLTVVPRDTFGNTGNTVKSHFFLDTQAPVVTNAEPASSSWCGLAMTNIKAGVSDAPNDQVTYRGAAIAKDASWQNSEGSGLKYSTASFTANVEFMSKIMPGAFSSNNMMEINMPAISVSDPAAAGWGTITANLKIDDNVNSLNPNSASYSWRIFMDYMRPLMTFSKPLSSGKYCRKTLDLGGSASDRGRDDRNIYVQKVEFSKDQATYIQADFAMGKIGSWTYNKLDISEMTDGPHKLYGRAYDRGFNMSNPDNAFADSGVETVVTFTVDRTPPEAPTAILPLNESITNNRGQRFKWNKVTDGDQYLFQIADDVNFNNVLNNLIQPGDATYSGLLGQVTYLPEASFSVAKDGTFYWRVAAIEVCNDGFNISAFSPTMRFIADTVKPKILGVQPTPSTGNKITTGMVTFTVRFTETMDTTVIPTVSLTSAGGQLMLIETVSFKDNTWTGTTVIPKDTSALYDGLAVLQVTNAKDLATNQMENDTSSTVVINTGPAFETKLFSNPAHEFEIMIVTRSSEALQAPPTCSVTQGAEKVPVVMNFLKEKFYTGGYRIDPERSGKAFIDISGSDIYGMTGRGSVEFNVAGVDQESSIRWVSEDAASELLIGSGTFRKKASIYMLPGTGSEEENPMVSKKASVKRASAIKDSSELSKEELIEIKKLEEFGPSSLKVSRKMRYSTNYEIPSGINIDPEKVGIYRYSSGGWTHCKSIVKGNKISAELDGLGKLALMADLKAPVMASIFPSNGERLEDADFTIEGKISDKGAGLLLESVKISIDGNQVTDVTVEEDGSFRYVPRKTLPKGDHVLEISASDKAGNQIVTSITFVAPGPFAIEDLKAYPNPARGDAIYFAYNFGQKAEEIRLKIYDTAGQQVTSFDTFDFDKLSSGKLKWDLRNDDGKKVANGVYLYKIEAIKNGQKIKSRGKLAVLR
ncbi:MAG: T9SS type A sorting domain-containing protein [Candidatus Riflebacteria bacterium]|nr:T9SS type A sorting domain-containing protein [Candidatus Riflebacteria bacterium]